MVSVLSFIGYGPVESLQLFLKRFTLQDRDTLLDNGLEKVWVCHKSVHRVSELQKILNSDGFDCQQYQNHYLTFNNLKYPIEEQSEDKFKSSVILQGIINKLHCCLAQYLLNDCILLYNWGINSFELVIENEEFNKKILTYQNASKKTRVFVDDQKDFRKWRYLLTNQSEKVGRRRKQFITRGGDLFDKRTTKARYRGAGARIRTRELSKLGRIYEECDKPFGELRKDACDPCQEMFDKDGILYDLKQRRWPGNHALSVNSPDKMLRRILCVEIRGREKENDINESRGWTKLRNIFKIILKNHKMVMKNDGYARILKRHLKDSGTNLSALFGRSDTVNVRTCQRWFGKFRSGDPSLGDHPTSIMMLCDPQSKIIHITQIEKLQKSLAFILQLLDIRDHIKSLGFVLKQSVWVPHELTEKNLSDCVRMCPPHLIRHDCRAVLDKLVTEDEELIPDRILGLGEGGAANSLRPVPISVVSSYVADILRRVLPLQFFGSNRLRKKFFSEITRIINGDKNENFIFQPVTQMFLKVKNNLPWLDEIQGWPVARRIVLKISKWLLLDYILLILRNLFYITDVGSSGYRLYYYKKNDMERAVSLWLNSQVLKKSISPVKGDLHHWNSVERKWLETGLVQVKGNERRTKMPESSEYIYPAAKVRFLPKLETGGDFRMITSYAMKKTVLRKSESRERQLVDVFMERHVRRLLVLRKVKFLLEYLVEKYGTGIKPVPNNPKLELAWTRALHLKKIYGRLYFVKADITDAYGSVLPSLLGAIIDEKLKVKSNHTMQMKKIKECRLRNGKIECDVRKTFTGRPRENCLLVSRSIFANPRKKLSSYDSKSLKSILDQVINNQYLRINGRYYRLIKGLTQGSAGSFSASLCEIYYSEMDRKYFGDFMTCGECVLLRGVDDYLLITCNVEKAAKFYGLVYNGVKDFNASFNRGKLKSNINEDISCVNYLGLIFNVEDMSVKPDYAKYRAKDVLSTTKLSDPFGNKFFRKTRFLRYRSLRMAYLKLLPVTLSNTFNNLSVIREIIYQASVVHSCKTLALTRHLFRAGEKNDLDVCVILSKSLGKMTDLIARFNKDISKDEITWLFWDAALSVFRRYSGVFPHLLVVIRYRLFAVENRAKSAGEESVLSLAIKDLKSGERWSDLRRTLRIVTRTSKPCNRLK